MRNKSKHYRADEVAALDPLLRSITNEIEERFAVLERLEQAIESLSAEARPDPDEIRQLVAEAAMHRREIRHAKQELDRLGCSVVGTEPLTLRIPGKMGEAKKSFVWQAGDPVLK